MTRRPSHPARWLTGSALLAGLLALGAAAPIEPNLISGLQWRMIGPFRGGRVSAVSGVIGKPGTFYIGLPLGGVWKTTSAGTTWYPIFDSVKEASSVGSVQVAPSDPNVIYVGMGDLITGGGINEGNGMYKSVDAGKTWQHLGLDETKQIPSILVDPKDPNLVLIAAQGNVHKLMDMRGVFRSTDGGKNWTKTLYVDNQAGAQEIAWAFDNPKVMLATTVQHYSDPLAGRGGGGGGGAGGAAAAPSRTKLFKSLDEGITWKEITGNGLPALTGRTSVAVAMNTNSQRMYLIGNFGLYRSDNGGDTWRQMAANDRRIANGQNGYNCGVYVDPSNPEIVYTINTSSFRSLDGGNTFTGLKGAPGGDDPQQMWIDPTNGQRMLLGVDQGATVSLDGGLTWSSWYNQATEQVYHISTDNSFPYWVYATQQDAGAIATRSRGDLGTVNWLDWLPTPGYEFGYIVADPLNPKIIYSGGPAAGVVKITYPSGQWINISPNMDTSLALRKVGNQPMAWSATNPRELLLGFQYLMSTTDGGAHWKKISPDLGYPQGVTPPPRSAAPAGRGAGAGTPAAPAPGSIESFSSSSVAPGVIWAGTNNGLIKVTKDHGATWTDVTIPDLPNPTRADISTIDASHHDAGEAYVAIDYHGVGDYAPYFFRTKDYGKTWTKIVNGFATDQPGGSFARVIRADTEEGRAALRRHRELDVRLVQRRRRVAVAHAQPAEHVVPRHRDQGQRSGGGHVRSQLLDSRRHLAAAADDAGGRFGESALLQAGRRDSRSTQRQRRHAVPAGSSARGEPAARRGALLLARLEALGRNRARGFRRRREGRAAHVERIGRADLGFTPGDPRVLEGSREADADCRGHEPDELGLEVRSSADFHAQLLERDGRGAERNAVDAGGTAGASGRIHAEAHRRRQQLHADGDVKERSALAGDGRGSDGAARPADETVCRLE